jgi:PAS domain-containing protein
MPVPTSATTEDTSLAHVHRLLDLLPAGACLCAPDGRITHYTAQAVDLWGQRPDAGDDAPRWCGAARLFDEDGRPLRPEDSPIARALDEGRPHHGRRLQLERPDGERRHALSYASPLLDTTGRVIGGLDLLVDITEQHRAAEAERERLRARGEQLVALACDIRAGLTPLRRGARDAGQRAQATALDEQLRHITRLVDQVINLEVDAD